MSFLCLSFSCSFRFGFGLFLALLCHFDWFAAFRAFVVFVVFPSSK
jgi:hypothetical protein